MRGRAGGWEQSPAQLAAHVRARAGYMSGALGVLIRRYPHVRAGTPYFGGYLGAGVSPGYAGRVRHF